MFNKTTKWKPWVVKTMLVMALMAKLAGSNENTATAEEEKGNEIKVEVVFALDTTGSMGGLIEGAKRKIWTIANNIIRDYPGASLHFGLVAYRDRGDAYITQKIDLTDDLDAIYLSLEKFEAGGGGDGPESVNEALRVAVHDMGWSAVGEAYKVIFLVGDAPPHMDYQDDVTYPVTCEVAARAGIIINTIQCGKDKETTQFWKEIALKAEGEYMAMDQDGKMATISTPMDKEIVVMSEKLAETVVAYGSEESQIMVLMKNSAPMAAMSRVHATDEDEGADAEKIASRYFVLNAGLMGDEATSVTVTPEMEKVFKDNERLSGDDIEEGELRALAVYAQGRAIMGRGDLIADIANGAVKLEEVKESDLSEEFQKMSAEERLASVNVRLVERAQINKKIAELARQREEYLIEEAKKNAPADGFDARVSVVIKEQVAKVSKKE